MTGTMRGLDCEEAESGDDSALPPHVRRKKKKELVELEQVSRGRVATIRTLSYRCVDAWGRLGPAPFHSPRLI